jgi:hypothetical protein
LEVVELIDAREVGVVDFVVALVDAKIEPDAAIAAKPSALLSDNAYSVGSWDL